MLVDDELGNFTLTNASGMLIVNAPVVEEPEPTPESVEDKGGIPWWVWLIVGVGALLVLILVLVFRRKKGSEEVIKYVQSEPAAIPVETTKVVHEVEYVDEGGFGEYYDPDDYNN